MLAINGKKCKDGLNELFELDTDDDYCYICVQEKIKIIKASVTNEESFNEFIEKFDKLKTFFSLKVPKKFKEFLKLNLTLILDDEQGIEIPLIYDIENDRINTKVVTELEHSILKNKNIWLEFNFEKRICEVLISEGNK